MSVWYARGVQYVKRNYISWLAKIINREVQSPNFVNFSEIKSILIVRPHDRLADLMLATPAIRALRQHYPQCRIGLVVREEFEEVACTLGEIDEIIRFRFNWRRWSLRDKLQFWREIRGRWDLAIVLNTISHSLKSDLIAHFSAATYVVGSEHKVFPGADRNFLYNLVAPYWHEERHQAQRNLDIVAHIGVSSQDLRERISLERQRTEMVMAKLVDQGLKRDRPLIGIHVGAGLLYHRWPVGRFGELARRLQERYEAQILLFWADGEVDLAKQFCRYIQFQPFKIGPTSARNLAAAMSLCDGMVCNDSDVLHLAAAVDVPLVGIYGPTDPFEWKPVGEKFLAIRGNRDRIDEVHVEQVEQALIRLLPNRFRKLKTIDDTFEMPQLVKPSEFDISENATDLLFESILDDPDGENSDQAPATGPNADPESPADGSGSRRVA